MKNKSENSGDNDDESISSDGVDVTTVNSTNQPLPPIKAMNSNNTKNESTHINIDDEEEPNYRDIFKEKSHLEITKWLEKRNLGDSVDKHTLIYHLLQNTVDGDKLVSNVLDGYVTNNSYNDTNQQQKPSLEIQFYRLESGSNKCDVVKDILRIKHTAANNILLHPVIEAYIDQKWIGVKKYVSAHFCIYLAFLLTYSWFLANIFYRPLHQYENTLVIDNVVLSGSEAISFPSTYQLSSKEIHLGNKNDSTLSLNEDGRGIKNRPNFFFRLRNDDNTKSEVENMTQRWNHTIHSHGTFARCYEDSSDDMRACAREVVMFSTVIFLLAMEVIQFISLGPYASLSELRLYFNFDNLIQLIVIFLAAACLVGQHDEMHVKWCSAFGIVFAYLEFVFLLGRCPPLPWIRAGQNSIMFYNITRRLLKILFNLFILVVGFAFGFFILQKDTPHDHFENPIKSIVKTLIMVLGEYELNDMIEGNFNDKFTLYVTMALLALLAIIGSLVMINLVVAIIVSDIAELKKEGIIQDTINKAYHIISHGNMLACKTSFKCKRIDDKNIKNLNENGTNICTHSICFDCKGIKVSPNVQDNLFAIVKKRNTVTYKYGASSV